MMGKKEKHLVNIIEESGNFKISNMPIPEFIDKLLFGSFRNEILNVYRNLGGTERVSSFRGKWDIITEKCIIELDEQLHFNDYRLTTLSSSLYLELKTFPLETYREYCRRYKDNCLKAGSFGGKWTNDSCERMFGSAQKNGDLTGNGSPRWKQRAFYDFIKDISYLVTNIPVVRLSVYDAVYYRGQEYALGELLESENTINEDAAAGIQELINKRL